MAVYNEILAGRFNRFLQKFLSMKGGPPSPQLGSEIVPAVNVFNGVENRYLEGWQRFAAEVQIIGSGGARGGVELRNPSASGMIAVLEYFSAYVGTAAVDFIQLFIGPLTTDLATPVHGMRLDPRGAPNSALIFSSQNTPTPSGLTILSTWSAPINTLVIFPFTENQEIPVLPGDALIAVEGTTAVQWNVTMIWRERPLEDSEKF